MATLRLGRRQLQRRGRKNVSDLHPVRGGRGRDDAGRGHSVQLGRLDDRDEPADGVDRRPASECSVDLDGDGHFSGTLGKRTPTLEFAFDAGSGRLDATVKLGGKNSTARVELLDAAGNVVSTVEGGSPLQLSTALSTAGAYRLRISAPGHNAGLSVELTTTYPRP